MADTATGNREVAHNRCMKLLGILFLLAVVASFYADYRWKRWMAARQAARELAVAEFKGRE